jgi:hypothetical protein
MFFRIRPVLIFFIMQFLCARAAWTQSPRVDVFGPQAVIGYDTFHAEYSVSIIFFTVQALEQHSRIGIDVSLFELQIPHNTLKNWSFFPFEIVYNPVNYNELLWIYVYAGGKVLFHSSQKTPAAFTAAQETPQPAAPDPFFTGQFGVRFSFLPPAKPKRTYQRNAVTVFLEYSTRNTFSVGISLPAGGLAYIINDWLGILNAEIEALIPPKEPE